MDDRLRDDGIDQGFDDDYIDEGMDGECQLRYEMLLARNRQKLESAGAQMIIWMMVSMMTFRDDGLDDWVDEGLDDDVSGDCDRDRTDEDGLGNYGSGHRT
jgi:hypothetical protein